MKHAKLTIYQLSIALAFLILTIIVKLIGNEKKNDGEIYWVVLVSCFSLVL